MALEMRIYETRPRRRDSPLRWENIRDEGVREIQTAAQGIVPEAIVNISGVVTGCPCEEGPNCSDQVWILATRPGQTLGLQLSKVGGHWVIGLIQNWWFEYEKLTQRESTFHSYWDYDEAVDELKEAFPQCPEGSDKKKGTDQAR